VNKLYTAYLHNSTEAHASQPEIPQLFSISTDKQVLCVLLIGWCVRMRCCL